MYVNCETILSELTEQFFSKFFFMVVLLVTW